MKILIVTGKLAGELVIKASSTKKHEVHVHIADIPIAAFLTPNRIINEIKKIDDSITSELDLVLIPGLIPRDASIITKETGIPAYKGPTDAADLPIVLDLLDKLKLSPKKAADKLIEEEQQKRALKFIKDFEEDEEKREKLLKKEENILVGELPVGRDFPMRVLSEVAKAPFLKKEELIKQVNYLVKNGADIIDIRTIPGENLSKQIPEIIKTVKRVVGNLPVSIDTLNPDEIKAAVKAGAELVLSLDHGNYKEVLPLLEEKNIPAVILPTDYTKGWIPETVKERVESLESLKRKCRGIDVIPDPILDPVNSKSIVDSIKACKEYTSRNPEPIFFGAGNVAELIDVDSTGVQRPPSSRPPKPPRSPRALHRPRSRHILCPSPFTPIAWKPSRHRHTKRPRASLESDRRLSPQKLATSPRANIETGYLSPLRRVLTLPHRVRAVGFA